MATADVTLNPLVLFKLEFADNDENIDLGDIDTLLYDLGWDDKARSINDVRDRYEDIRKISRGFNVAPAEDRIQSKVISTVRQAIANYVLSNYLSTIALCGMAAEMVAMLAYDMICVLKDMISESDVQKMISFTRFEGMPQAKRIEYLTTFQNVESRAKIPFDRIRKLRNRYLHRYTQDMKQVKRDALVSYRCIFSLVKCVLPHQLTKDGIAFAPFLLEYMKRKGTARD